MGLTNNDVIEWLFGSTKVCKKCGEKKPIEEFVHENICKACFSAGRQEYWDKNRNVHRTTYKERDSLWHNWRKKKIRLNGGTITGKEWDKLKAKYNFTCLCCGRREPEIKLTLDHVVPIARGGKNSIDNAQPLCKSCNSRKHTQIIDYRP